MSDTAGAAMLVGFGRRRAGAGENVLPRPVGVTVDVMPDGVTHFGHVLPFVNEVRLIADKGDGRIRFGQGKHILVIQTGHAVGMRLTGPRLPTPFRPVDLNRTEYLQQRLDLPINEPWNVTLWLQCHISAYFQRLGTVILHFTPVSSYILRQLSGC